MRIQSIFIDFILKEWLLIASGVGLALTSFHIQRIPSYTINEIQVLFILLILFITVNGLQKSGFILKIAQTIEKKKAIPLKLVLLTFFLSMLVTNDVALIGIVPLTLSLSINRKDILVILEALAANSGSALTPVGNPQNLFIYWFYNVSLEDFIKTIAPFSLTLLGLLIFVSIFVRAPNKLQSNRAVKISKESYAYVVSLVIVLLAVFHVLPLLSGIIVIFYALIFDRKALSVDYSLLLSFFFFFGIADNLKVILSSELNHSGHIFVFSALASQFMSNVPATLLFANFTSNWQALLWGANAGGFGSLFGSLANLIAYRIYVTHVTTNDAGRFTAKFLVIGYLALFISAGLYFLLYRTDVLS